MYKFFRILFFDIIESGQFQIKIVRVFIVAVLEFLELICELLCQNFRVSSFVKSDKTLLSHLRTAAEHSFLLLHAKIISHDKIRLIENSFQAGSEDTAYCQ